MTSTFQGKYIRCIALAIVSIFSSPITHAESLSACLDGSPLKVPFMLGVGTKVPIDKFDEVILSDGVSQKLPLLKKGDKSPHVISQIEVDQLFAWGVSGTPQIVFKDTTTPTKSCRVLIQLPPSGEQVSAKLFSGGNFQSTSTEVDPSDCQEEAGKYYAQIETNHKQSDVSGGFSLVVFCGATTVFQESRERRDGGIAGEPIYVGLYDTSGIANFRFEFINCSAETVGPRGYISGSFKSAADQIGNQASRSGITNIIPAIDRGQQGIFRRCYNDSVDVLLKGQPPSGAYSELARYSLRQAQTYHFTTQIGIVSTDNVSHKYVLSDDGLGNKKIRDAGPVGDGPRYFASVVLYGLPHQLESLFTSKSYRGRALQYDNRFPDRLGLLLGVGLSNPKDEFVSGLTLEIMTGVNLVWVYRWAKIEVLDGVSVGNTYSATTQLPTQEKWKRDLSLGVSLDLRYVTSLFDRR